MLEDIGLSATIRNLVAAPGIPELGPGTPNHKVRSVLAALCPENAFTHVGDRSMAMACIAGLWLLHDFLDESHAISQEIHSAAGSYWHAIMHRREPDASNSKYWFRQVGYHPVFDELSATAKELGYWKTERRWNPAEFVDCCEAERGTGSEREMILRRVQLREWEQLFSWCARAAVNG